MFKFLLVAMFLFVLTPGASAADWVMMESGREIDFASLKFLNDGNRSYWIKYKMSQKQFDNAYSQKSGMKYRQYSYSLLLAETDCQKKHHKIISFYEYSPTGEVIYSGTSDSQGFRPIVPGSIAELEFAVLCDTPRQEQPRNQINSGLPGCSEYQIVDHGDSVEAVCVGAPLSTSERSIREQETDISQNAEQYINGRTRQQYEQCQSFMPEVRTADEYGKMSIGQIMVDKLARKSAMARLEAMGCIPRGSSASTTKPSTFVSCNTIGSTTICSDGSSFNKIGNSIIGSNGTNCTISGSNMSCIRP